MKQAKNPKVNIMTKYELNQVKKAIALITDLKKYDCFFQLSKTVENILQATQKFDIKKRAIEADLFGYELNDGTVVFCRVAWCDKQDKTVIYNMGFIKKTQ